MRKSPSLLLKLMRNFPNVKGYNLQSSLSKIKTNNASEKKQYTLNQPNSYPISNLDKTNSLNRCENNPHTTRTEKKRKHLLQLVFVSREVGSQFFDIDLFAFHFSSSKFYSDYFSSGAESNQLPLSNFFYYLLSKQLLHIEDKRMGEEETLVKRGGVYKLQLN